MEKTKEYNWGPIIFFITYHILLLVGLPLYLYYNVPQVGMLITTFVLLYLTGLSITAGYHRYYAHRSYRTGTIVETVLLFFGSMAVQASALRWAFDHRIHHAKVDTDEDPYTITKGFWYAHCLWIIEKPTAIDTKIVPDLLKNKLVMFQDRYYKLLMIATNALVVVLFGWLFDDFLGALVLAFGVRMFLLHHFTWFINSLAHTWGDKPFSQELTAVDNYFLAMLTFGEGYHNFHHTYANDYRNGIRWYHFDPTKWLIWTLHKLGLAHGLRKVDGATIEKRMVIEQKNLLLEQIKESYKFKKDELETTIHEMSERIVAKISEFNQLKEQYYNAKKQKPSRDLIKGLRHELKSLKKSLRKDWNSFLELSDRIMNNKPLVV
jgi:stearoyl-CoA desaturase (delta-9 desaturase)